MAGGVGQAHLLVLALHLYQQGADAAQQADADRMVVDKGAGPPVARDNPAQNDLVLRRQSVFVELGRDGMVVRRGKAGGDRCLFGPGTDQPGIRARTQCQTKTVQKDRLACPCFPGQHCQPRRERQIQPLDQHNVTDGQRGQHAAPRRPARRLKNRMPGAGEEAALIGSIGWSAVAVGDAIVK